MHVYIYIYIYSWCLVGCVVCVVMVGFVRPAWWPARQCSRGRWSPSPGVFPKEDAIPLRAFDAVIISKLLYGLEAIPLLSQRVHRKYCMKEAQARAPASDGIRRARGSGMIPKLYHIIVYYIIIVYYLILDYIRQVLHPMLSSGLLDRETVLSNGIDPSPTRHRTHVLSRHWHMGT